MSDERRLREGEIVLLWRRSGDSLLVPLQRGPQTVDNRGVVRLDDAVDARPGTVIGWAGAEYRVFRPSLSDLLAHLQRRAQIVTPKDAQFLLYLAGVGPGSTVVEAGSGSGALTIVLAHAVGPTGRVISLERREDFLRAARENVRSSGLETRVEFQERDVVRDGLDAHDVDAVVLDIPEPWEVFGSAHEALVSGGHLATYTPTYNQLERGVRSMHTAGFAEVRSLELLERAMHVGEGGTRPEFEMLGHTGFLTGARRVD